METKFKSVLLKDIGLTDSETKVYLALIELGSSTKGPIVKKSGVASSKIYELLEKLIDKGLVSYVIKSGVRYFEAADTNRLMDYMKEKEHKVNEQKKELEKIIPFLEMKRSSNISESQIQVFRGIKGAKTAFYDMLNVKKGDEILVLGLTEASESFQNFLVRFHRKRSEKGILCRAISGGKMKKFNTISSLKHTKVKLFPGELSSPVATITYNDKTILSLPNDNIWIQIKNKRLADTNRARFEEMWNRETEILEGVDAIQQCFDEMLEAGHCDLIGARGYFVDERPEYIDEWEKRAKKKGFTMRNIVDPEVKGHRITKFSFAKTKYTLPKGFSELSVYWIYGNKVAISNWMGEKPIVVRIENKRIYELYKKQFEILWKEKVFR
ncbi:MAG: helix-turn-helix domain-containing protein [Candidatus Aenigmarchaeota archaeon]|nr:helix-turn-helix domain-containing protein [Candidatus Aenigmarchaeota archaeon]